MFSASKFGDPPNLTSRINVVYRPPCAIVNGLDGVNSSSGKKICIANRGWSTVWQAAIDDI